MKTILFIHILLMIIVYSCREKTTKDAIQEFIPGTYIRFSQHEFGTEYDTLVISLQNSAAHEYKILRKWKYKRMLDGQPIEPEYKQVTTSGIFNSSHKLLRENETGDTYTFDIQAKTLFNGAVKYQKL